MKGWFIEGKEVEKSWIDMRNPSMGSKVMSSSSSSQASGTSGKVTPCCSREGLKRGPWTPEEDETLSDYIRREGEGRWRTLPKRAGLLRCGKSCRLRWMNYLRPSLKRGQIAPDEEDLILRLHRLLGNRWALIAGRIPGRTDNDIKNYWNTHLSKKLISQGIDPRTHKPLNPNTPVDSSSCFPSTALEPLNSNNNVSLKPNSPSVNEMVYRGKDNNNTEYVEGTIELQQHYNWQNYNTLMTLQRSNELNEHIGNSTGGDDVFSSLLNSWIYEEVFGYNSIYAGPVSSYGQPGFDEECKRLSDHVNKCF